MITCPIELKASGATCSVQYPQPHLPEKNGFTCLVPNSGNLESGDGMKHEVIANPKRVREIAIDTAGSNTCILPHHQTLKNAEKKMSN